MIRTITEAEALTLAVLGDVPGVLDGAEALVIQTCLDCEAGAVEVGHCAACGEPKVRSCPSCGGTGGDRVLLLANQLVQAHLVGWLGRGERRLTPGHLTMAARGSDCPGCDGSGWIRRPVNRYPWLTPEAHGGLPDWIRMALIWGSVVRVAAGMEALRAAEPVPVSPRGPFTVGNAVAWWTATEERRGWFATRSNGVVLYPGWVWDTEHGPEIGAAALDRIYSCVMSQGFALIDEAPTGRAIRFEVPDAP